MRHPDPWSAIVADLTRPATVTLPRSSAPSGPATPSPRVVHGRPFSAREPTIRLLKARSAGRLRLYAVAFDDQDGQPVRMVVGAEQHEDGWGASGSAGGGGESPRRGRPWVNLAAWWGRDRFCAGGEVVEADDVRSVRLTTRDGFVLEDDVEAGVVLFLADRRVEVPVVLELHDGSGEPIASQVDIDLPEQ
jgi:hypothetical protein